MKKIYTFLILIFTVTTAFSQTWRYINAAGTEILWSNSANWSANTLPVSGDRVGVWNPTESVDLDVDLTVEIFQNNGTRPNDLVLLSNLGNTLTIDVNSRTNFGATTSNGIRNWTSAATNLKIDCSVIVNNSMSESGANYDDWTSFEIEDNVGNSIEFGSNSSLALAGEGGTGLFGDGIGEFFMNGALSGTQVLGVGLNTKVTFGSTFVNNSFTGGVTVYAGAEVIVNTPDGVKFSNKKLQANGTGATVTLNNANVMGKEISIQGPNVLDINVNANQGLSHITFTGSGDGTLNLNIDSSVTELGFWRNHLKDWGTGTLNINGYQEGVLNFGPDNITPGLTAQQLSQITINGQVPNGGNPLSLDATGHLIGASDLVLNTEKHDTFEFSIYPNPASTQISVQSVEPLKSAQVFDVLGRKVLETFQVESIDISNLRSGMYVLQLEAVNGGFATKKIVKK